MTPEQAQGIALLSAEQQRQANEQAQATTDTREQLLVEVRALRSLWEHICRI